MNRAPAALVALLASSLPACGDLPPPKQAVHEEGLPTPSVANLPPEPATPGSAHALVVKAAACWFGGMWSDAEGAANAEDRRIASEKRCSSLVQRLYGSDDHAKLEAFRRVEKTTLERLTAEVDRLATGEPLDGGRKDALDRLLAAVAAAQHEANDAHIDADAVKRDLKDHEEQASLSKDEAVASKTLRVHAGLEGLLKLQAGDLTTEAHAMGLMLAMDRMELARGLPKHLKVYAVEDAYQIVFGIAPPAVSDDATAKLKAGTWLGYLADAARAAGHPVPDKATHPREREPWAWGGVLEGFTDRLHTDAAKLDKGSSLGRALAAILTQLDAEWAEVPSIAASQKLMADREEAAKGKK